MLKSQKGKNNPFYGKHHSVKTKAILRKVAQKRLGKDASNYRHGMRHSPEYQSWCAMKTRVLNPNQAQYADYGGRGIRFCKRMSKFPGFFETLGEKPEPKREYTLDRVKNNRHYSCGMCKECVLEGWKLNVCWSTRQEQNRNRRPRRWVKRPRKE